MQAGGCAWLFISEFLFVYIKIKGICHGKFRADMQGRELVGREGSCPGRGTWRVPGVARASPRWPPWLICCLSSHYSHGLPASADPLLCVKDCESLSMPCLNPRLSWKAHSVATLNETGWARWECLLSSGLCAGLGEFSGAWNLVASELCTLRSEGMRDSLRIKCTLDSQVGEVSIALHVHIGFQLSQFGVSYCPGDICMLLIFFFLTNNQKERSTEFILLLISNSRLISLTLSTVLVKASPFPCCFLLHFFFNILVLETQFNYCGCILIIW